MDRKDLPLLVAIGLHAPITFAQNYAELDINDVRARFHSHGLISEDLQNNGPVFEVPAGDGAHTLYSAGLWIGGITSDSQLRIAAQMYEALGAGDFYPGPLTIDGSASITPEVSQQYDQVWSVLRSDIDQHLAWIACLSDPNCDIEAEFPNGYIMPASFLNWPALGDVEAGQDLYLAPFIDFDGDGNYDPFSGDYPCVPGDQALYAIFNDAAGPHVLTGSPPIGLEIHMMPFAYHTGDPAIDQTVFVHYRIINRGTLTLTGTRIGMFQDFDIGCANDDYVGTDAKRNLTYGLNSDNFDEDCLGSAGYGEKPPTFGSVILKGPLMDADATDNLQQNTIPAWNGTGFGDGPIDNERGGLAYSHHFYREGDPAVLDPYTGIDFYNALSGIWKDNIPQSYGGTGYSVDPNAVPARFVFPGDSDPLGVGTGGVVLPPWTEESAGNTAYDPRIVSAMAPFTLEPGMVQEILMAFIYARSPLGEPHSSVDALRSRADSVRAFAANIPGIMAPGSLCDQLPTGVLEVIAEPTPLELFPVPATDRIIVRTGDLKAGTYVRIIDGRGALVMQLGAAGAVTGFDISALPAGLYTVSAADGNAIRIGRFVKE